MTELQSKAIELLKRLINTPSISREEDKTALVLEEFFTREGIPFHRKNNNIWAKNLHFDSSLPTILLNSHHDTVKPNSGYTKDPFTVEEVDGKIYGLGSNDAGGPLVGLIATFVHFYPLKTKYNLIMAATAEEEISGEHGIAEVLPELGKIDFAIVGEPTKMDLAIAEKGLVVLNCVAKGTSSHAAHPNDDNAIYNAIKDIEILKNYEFEKVSEVLGKVKITVSMINAGTQHNVVPDKCTFTVDIRTNEFYSNAKVVEILKPLLKSEIQPRSLILNSSFMSPEHPFAQAAKQAGCQFYGSPTISDQALMPFDSVKIGPGDSLRSHTADEFIYRKEVEDGIEKYIKILSYLM